MDSKEHDEQFSLFLESKKERGGLLRLPVPLSKTLKGRYKVALKSLSCKRQKYIDFPSEPIYFMVLTQSERTFLDWKDGKISPAKKGSPQIFIASWQLNKDSSLFKHVLVYGVGTRESVMATPKGVMSLPVYIGWIDSMLHLASTEYRGGVQIEWDKVIVKVYKHNDSVVIPIFGPKTRFLLGFPDPSDHKTFTDIVSLLSADATTHIASTRHNLKNKLGDIIVACNISEPNAEKKHAALSDRQLRVINHQLVNDIEHGYPIEFSFDFKNEFRIPVVPGKYDEIIIQLIQEDNGHEVDLIESARACITFIPPQGAGTEETVLVVPDKNVKKKKQPESLPVVSYRKRLVKQDIEGNIVQNYEPKEQVICDTCLMDWLKFSQPYS